MVVGLGALLGSGAARSATLPQEPPIAGEGVEADYLRALHEQIHPLWAGLFVREIAEKMAPASPINDPSRTAVVLFAVRWDGTPAGVTLVKESGLAAFDRGARESILRADHFPVPPVALFSDDGLAHFRWVLARDQRLCSGGELHRFEEPLAEAMIHLLIEGRVEEALWRLERRAAALSAGSPAGRDAETVGGEDPVAVFARAWLSRPQPDPVTEGRAAAALARAGDATQIPRLRVALARRDTVIAAALALRGLKVEICPLVEKQLADRDPAVREIAVQALGVGGGGLPASSPCVQVLGTMAQDANIDGKQRALAARAAAAAAADGARRLLTTLLADHHPAVRAAALSLLARPGGGRPVLYRGLPFLHDPEVEVRAAAAAALLRSCGDLALDQLVLVWKEPGAEVGVAVANELGRMSSAASEAFLVRLSKRQNPEIRAATAEALAVRRASAARPASGRGVRNAAPVLAVTAPSAGAPLVETTSPALRAVAGLGRCEAIAWVLVHYRRLDPLELIEIFGSWLGPNGAREPASVSAR